MEEEVHLGAEGSQTRDSSGKAGNVGFQDQGTAAVWPGGQVHGLWH